MRRLVISDLHFGSPGALGSLPFALERLAPELEWAEELIICGDLFTLMFADWETATAASRPFLDLVAGHVKSLVLVPGNHDHHLVLMDADQRDQERALLSTGDSDVETADSHRLKSAEGFMERLLPGVSVQVPYPSLRLDGVTYIHGHQVAAMIREVGIPILDSFLFRLAAAHPPERTAVDYEALLAPFFEIAYLTQRFRGNGDMVTSKHSQGLLDWSQAGMVSSGSQRQIRIILAGRRLAQRLSLGFHARPLGARLQLLARMCHDLGIAPGPVIYAHTHTAHDGLRAKGDRSYTFHNSGSWNLAERFIGTPNFSHPGTVLRVEDGRINRRELLEEFSDQELRELLLAHRHQTSS